MDLVGECLGTNPRGSMGRATASIDGEQIGKVGRVLYAHVPHTNADALRAQFKSYGGEL